MPDRVPYNERHAHLFEKNLGKSTTQAEPFARQLASEIPFGRYDKVFYGINNEELYAQRQSALDQLANGTAKMAGTFTTSFLEGTVGVINGLAEYASTGNFSSFYDNSFNRSLDEMNKSMEDALPNYYTQAEKDAEWWSSTNILSANFFGDKILKNLGYSFGALAGGYGWGAVLKGIGLTAKLVRAGQGLKALQAVETAMVNAPKAQKFGAINQALNSVWNSTKGAVGTALTNSERAIISSTGMLGEATIEALQSSNEFRNKLIDDYKNLYGVNPTGEDLEEINSYADNVGNTVFGANAALLSVSNFIQLPKILGSSKTAEKRMINNITREGAEVGSKFVAGTPSTGNILSPVVGALGKPGRLLDKYALGPGRLAFSTGEALEEGMQYAAQVGTQDYFERAYANKEEVESTLDGIVGSMRSIATEGVRRALTDKEGLESILIGGVSGALQKGITNIRERGLTGTGGVYGKNTQLAINALNKTNINDVLRDGVRYTGIAIGSQKLRQEAIKNDDVLNEKDYEKDFELSYILPRVKYGKVDSILQEIDYYRQQVMSPTGFQELMDSGIVLEGETKEKFTERLNSLEETAKNTDRLYSSIEDKYSGVVVDNKPLYSDAAIDKLTYAAAKISDYDKRIPSVASSLISAGVDVQSVLSGIITNNKPSAEATQDALEKINALDVLSEKKDGLKRDLRDVMELSLRRKLFIEDYEGVKKNPEKYKSFEKSIETEEPITVSQTEVSEETGKEKTVDKELELGREYSLKQFVNIQGGKLNLAPKLTVLSKTLGGEYEVRLPDGTETFLKPKDFKQYQLTETETDSKKIKQIVDDAIDTVLADKKYENIAKPTGDKVVYVNSLKNPELLDDIEKEVASKSEKFFEEVKKEEELSKKEELIKALDETSDVGVPTEDVGEGSYEPDAKKTDQQVTDGTTPPVEGYSQREPLADHHVRANRFGANYYTFANRDNFRGVIVTQGNEAKIGLPGLTQWLKDEGKKDAVVDPKTTIAMVVMGIDPVTNERYFVGVNGERLEKPTLENTIYQVFPETLEWSSGDSMFRETTPDNVKKALTADYNKWREATLKTPTDNLYRIEASFGIPQYAGELDEDGNFRPDYTARIPVEASGLVTDVDLRTKRLIGVPTTDGAVVYGSSTFNDAKGVPLLYTNNGLVRLNNRKINEKEASLIYDVIVKLADNLFKDGNLKSSESAVLYNWLKSVVYWGTPKDAQGNRKPAKLSSIFFEEMNLIMGKDEKKFSLKPSELQANKAAIIEELQNMYNNVNSTLVSGGQKKDWNKKYLEITEITPEGIKTREWKNYQSFLLSSKNPDGSARNANAIPLTTRIRPLKDAEDTNRKGIYFTVIDKKSASSQEPLPNPVEKKEIKKTEEGTKKEQPVDKFNFAKGAENSISSKLGDIPFVVDIEKFKETDGKQGIALPDPETDPKYKVTLEGAILKLSKIPKSGITEETPDEEAIAITENIFRNLVKSAIQKELVPAPAEEAPSVAPSTAPSVAPSTPVSTDVEADVERKKSLSQELISFVWERLAKKGITNADSVIGTRETIDGVDFDKFWSNVTKEDLQNLRKLYETKKLEQLDLYNKFKGEFDPSTGTITSNDTSFFDNKIKNVDAELAALEGAKSAEAAPSIKIAKLDVAIPEKSKENKELTIETSKKLNDHYKDSVDTLVLDNIKIVEDKNIKEGLSDYYKKAIVPLGTFVHYKVLSDAIKSPIIRDFRDVKDNGDGTYTVKGTLELEQNSDLSRPVLITLPKEVFDDYLKKRQEADKSRDEYKKLGFKDISEAMRGPEAAVSTVKARINRLISEKINDLYKQQTSIVEKPAEAPTPVTPSKSLQQRINERKKKGPSKRSSDYRMMLAQELNKLKPENWVKVEAFLKNAFPNIPVYRVKNYIMAANGRRAHGMFENGAIYLSQSGQVGTIYHEVFHAIWQALTDPSERANINNEFRSRSGVFFDRVNLKNVKYSEATDKQIEEKLAEELREYIQDGKAPQKPAQGKKSWIATLFYDLLNFFKTFFTGENAKSNTEKLFEKIGSGYYKRYNPYDSSLSFAKVGFIDIEDAIGGELADYSLDVFTGEQVHDIMQHMTYATVRDLFEDNQGLFEIAKETKSDLFKKLQDEIGDVIAENITELEEMMDDNEIDRSLGELEIEKNNVLYENIINNWESLTEKFEEYIKSYSIEFDENEDVNIATEKSKDDGIGDARKIDNMRKTNAAVKLLLASLPVVDANGVEVRSSIGGFTLYPMSEMFMGVMNNVHNSRSMTDMLNRVKAMAADDPKYRKLYVRLSKKKNINELNDEHDLQLLAAFWRSFKKQSPDVKTVYILDNGDIQVGDANFTTAARQVKEEFLNNIKEAISKGSKYFKKADNGKSYVGNADAIKDSISIKDNLQAQVEFLKELGIEFDYDRLVLIPEKSKFSDAVNGIRTSIANSKSIVSVGGRSLAIDGRLRELAEIKAKMDNPEFSSTYYNVNGELTQTFIGVNAASELYDTLSQIKNLNELAGTQYEYLLTDSFAKKNSVLLYKMFDRETGVRISDTEQLMKTAYADGVVNQKKGRQKESSKLNYKERLIQELNLNLAGYYLNLIPGDASIGWAMYMGNTVAKSEIALNYDTIYNIFRGYLEDEIALAKGDRPVAKNRNSGDLRFFKSILGEELQNDVLGETNIDEVYEKHGDKINSAIDAFIEKERGRLKSMLTEYGSLTMDEGKYKTTELAFGKEAMTEEELNLELDTLNINFAINNIELHKLLYSDPYQYSEELKRIKSFSSPRQAIINSSDEMNTALNNVWNKSFKEGDLGHTDFEKDYFRGATIGDALATSDLKDYGVFEESDGGGIISLKGLRNFKIRAGEWDSDQERQYKYDVAWEKRDKKQKLSNSDKNALKEGNPGVKRTYTPIKPIVSGNKANGRSYNDVVLDKFALYPLSYRILKEINPTSNAIKLYDKMQKEDVDYAIFKSGRKVGAENVFPLYKDGKFNEDNFVSQEELDNPLGPQTVLNVPFAIMSIQSEVPSKDEAVVTRGSQMTKLATLDFMQAGVPIDFMPEEKDANKKYTAWNSLTENQKLSYKSSYGEENLYKLIKENQEILETLVEEGMNELTSEFGLTKTPDGYKIESIEKVADALRKEITKREVNDNISAALKGFKNGDTFFEATPAYQQIRNILYSIADRAVMSPKMSGSMKVQIPSTLLESGERIVAKNGALTSDVLKFYTDKNGERVCEIMIGRWFDSDLSDKELMDYFNNDPEGRKQLAALTGVAFRIPTQKQNSIDVFKIAKFLPKEFGDSVVIPSALVKKSGSDFDIDKLNIYLKNMDTSGRRPVVIPFYGTSEDVRNGFRYRSDFKKSLENGYITSLEKLTSHPLNFQNLIKPNSADQLKGLSKEIVNKLGLGTFDYNDPGNMLSRRFMSRLRHAYVTGKYAIGIAAVNQTNHSLNQRQPVYIDFSRATLSAQDKIWLGDGKINFRDYNSIEIDGEQRPTTSMIMNKSGEYISDVLGQMIDGYVDITKDPWIIEMGITPNVASTWMLLVKLGVPIRDVAYFMNQPIIRDYLRELDKKGSTWLFDKKLVKRLQIKYKGSSNIKINKVPTADDLLSMIGNTKLSPVEKTTQKFILNEFLKYAMMGQQLFYVTQGTNFDTATFNDPFLLFKKFKMLDKARNTIFSSTVDDKVMSAADALLDNSFLGKLKDGAMDVREALSEILRMDKGPVRELLQDVLTPYVNQSDRDFIRTSQRAVTTLIDWAVQTENNLNEKIEDFLLSKEKNVAKRITDFIATIHSDHELAGNHIVKILKPNFADPLMAGEVNNLYLKNKTNKLYDQNQIIYGFKELKNYLQSQNNVELYNDLVTLSILQSGLSQSTVSFTSLLPYDDVKNVYNEVIGNLSVMSNLQAFKDLNVFERTFWNYDDVVPHMEAEYRTDWQSGFPTYNENMMFRPDIYNAMKNKELPILLRISESSREANNDVIVYTYEKDLKSAEKRKMRQAGDYSFIKKGLFKKVGLVNGNYIYKAINAWGDGIYAKEFYNIPHKSKIDNGFIQGDETITDAKIMSYFGVDLTEPVLEEDALTEDEVVEQEIAPTPTPVVPTAPVSSGEREYTPEIITSLKPNEVFVFGSNTEGRHGAGAAKTAVDKFGAKYGQAEGLQGQSFGIITKDLSKGERSVPLEKIQDGIVNLLSAANKNPNKKFYVTKIGTGLGGFKVSEIKDIFQKLENAFGINNNIILPKEFEVRNIPTAGTTETVEEKPVEQEIDKTFVPSKINKNSNKFYSIGAGGVYFERYGKKLVVPEFEDINLMIEQGTKTVFELSTGSYILTTGKSEKAIIEELKELFEKKNIREILSKTKKTNINNDIIYKNSLLSFDKAFSPERQKEILKNFTAKHKVTEDEALAEIMGSIALEGQMAIKKLKECY